MSNINNKLEIILSSYFNKFNHKDYDSDSEETDVLMNAFGITQQLKAENKQYWGRELGMCWQLIVTEVFKFYCKDFSPALKFGADEPADLIVGKDAIDTKYRVGSGDSGTLKKFKQYGALLSEQGYTPTLLFLRTDNLHAAITACKNGGWNVYVGDQSFDYIQNKTGFDLKEYLIEKAKTKELFIKR